MVELSTGAVSMPPRTGPRVAEVSGVLGVMPAYLPGSQTLACKLVSIYPNNAAQGLPTHSALILVFDAPTGLPLALMDGTDITATRTGCGLCSSNPPPGPTRRVGAGYRGDGRPSPVARPGSPASAICERGAHRRAKRREGPCPGPGAWPGAVHPRPRGLLSRRGAEGRRPRLHDHPLAGARSSLGLAPARRPRQRRGLGRGRPGARRRHGGERRRLRRVSGLGPSAAARGGQRPALPHPATGASLRSTSWRRWAR